MSTQEILNYGLILKQLKDKIKAAQTKAVMLVNNELLKTYWEIGNVISGQEKNAGWGAKVIDKLSSDLKSEFSEMRGLSPRSLRYMRDFANAYPNFLLLQQLAAKAEGVDSQEDVILQQAAAKLPWGHHQVILTRLKSLDERLFYIKKVAENGWSRKVLEYYIDGKLHKTQGAITNNFRNMLPDHQSELVVQMFKDPYKLDFILLGEQAKERDLENALLTHITKFLLELGDGFAFIGRQKLLSIDGKEFYIDLLFYHTKLRRHVIIELKIGEFEPEYVGKMNFYLGLADDQLKGEYDQSAIGLILCKTKSKVIAEYALRDTTKPIGIAEYKTQEILPEDIKGELPSIEEIEARLDEKMNDDENPMINKLKHLLTKVEEFKEEQVEIRRSDEVIMQLFDDLVMPLKRKILEGLQSDLIPLFNQANITLYLDGRGFSTDEEATEYLVENTNLQRMRMDVRLLGFKKGGLKAFNTFADLHIYFDEYKYSVGFKSHAQDAFWEKLYHQTISDEELSDVSDKLKGRLIDDIMGQLDRVKGV